MRLFARTAAQVLIFWGVFLFVIPPQLARFETSLGSASASWKSAGWLAAPLFLLASALGLSSAVAIIVWGEGTPLPMDGARHLVLRGPYRYVRNPMAIAGLAQGVAVGLWLQSWIVLAYAGFGGIVWHYFVRPREESYLLQTFGADYSAYRMHVPLWLPRRPRNRSRSVV